MDAKIKHVLVDTTRHHRVLISWPTLFFGPSAKVVAAPDKCDDDFLVRRCRSDDDQCGRQVVAA